MRRLKASNEMVSLGIMLIFLMGCALEKPRTHFLEPEPDIYLESGAPCWYRELTNVVRGKWAYCLIAIDPASTGQGSQNGNKTDEKGQ